MKHLLSILMIITVVAGTIVVVVTTGEPRPTIAQQPEREPYVAPVWVTNERGQRCIKQGTTVTCG